MLVLPPTLHGVLNTQESENGETEEGIYGGRSPWPSQDCEGQLPVLELEGPVGPSPEEVVGTYHVKCADGCFMGKQCVQSFTIGSEDVLPSDEKAGKMWSLPATPTGSGKVTMHLLCRKGKTAFTDFWLARLIRHFSGDVVYVLAVSDNGTVHVCTPPGTGTLTKMCLHYADCGSCFSFLCNLRKAFSGYRCSLGVFYKRKAGPAASGASSGLVLMHLNTVMHSLSPHWVSIRSDVDNQS